MGNWLVFCFLFYVGSVSGWVLELFFRRFISGANPERKWINPGFLAGPCLPLYGMGLCFLYMLSVAESELEGLIPGDALRTGLLIVSMCISMTLLELAVGLICLKGFNLRLWDYRSLPGNYRGLVCPQFSLIWTALGVLYYAFLHPHVEDMVKWLSDNLQFSFFVGMFFGVFFVDLAYSTGIVVRIKRFADENDVVVRYEQLKSYIRSVRDERKLKIHFITPLKTDSPFLEDLNNFREHLERRLDLEYAFRRHKKH